MVPQLYQFGKNKSKTYVITLNFFSHLIAILVFEISQAKKISEKSVLSPICGFFKKFLALFDTFTTRYIHPDMKFEFFDQFQYIKHFI